MPNLLTFSDGIIKLDGKTLQGILSSLRVKVAMRFDNQDIDGVSGKTKVPKGWADADISFACLLLTDDESTCYDKLKSLNSVFRTRGEDGAKVFDINNKHLTARGVRQVVFSNLESAEDNTSDEINVTIQFTEYVQPVEKPEMEGMANTAAPQNNPAKNEPEKDALIMVDAK